MTAITIIPKNRQNLAEGYRALAGCRESSGATIGAALDAFTAQATEAEASTLVIIQRQLPDEFFTRAQQQRLAALMETWRQARDEGRTLSPALQRELEELSEAELRGATLRAETFLQELAR